MVSVNGIPVRNLPYLNLGCGKTHLPATEPPQGHGLVNPAIYSYPLWVNVDKVEGVGADLTFDLFRYPWPIKTSSFDGALCAHIVEHIPHEIKEAVWEDTKTGIKYIPPNAAGLAILGNEEPENLSHSLFSQRIKTRAQELSQLQDGWYAFFSELYRVLTNGAHVHIISPWGFSDGGITDPSHTRYLTFASFTHSMTPDSDGATFQYNNGGINFKIVNTAFRLQPYFQHLLAVDGDSPSTVESKNRLLQEALATRINVAYDMMVELVVVK